jgi:hypothetical protein
MEHPDFLRMQPVERVRAHARFIMLDPSYVTIDPSGIHALGTYLRDWRHRWTETKPAPAKLEVKCRQFLIANSINYCFWEKKADHKPAGGAATLFAKMEQLVEAFPGWHRPIRELTAWVAEQPFPFKLQRMEHLRELLRVSEDRYTQLAESISQGATGAETLATLTKLLPSYNEDPFLKRALLYPQAVFKDSGYGRQIDQLPIPADYQVPKMFRTWHVLVYSPILSQKVDQGIELSQGSKEEMEIRAATIAVAETLSSNYGIPPYVLDDFTWHQRKTSAEPYHLTRTTYY